MSAANIRPQHNSADVVLGRRTLDLLVRLGGWPEPRGLTGVLELLEQHRDHLAGLERHLVELGLASEAAAVRGDMATADEIAALVAAAAITSREAGRSKISSRPPPPRDPALGKFLRGGVSRIPSHPSHASATRVRQLGRRARNLAAELDDVAEQLASTQRGRLA